MKLELLNFTVTFSFLSVTNVISYQPYNTRFPELGIDILKYKVPCNLRWEPYDYAKPFPANVVRLNYKIRSSSQTAQLLIHRAPHVVESDIIARGKVLGEWVIGSIDSKGISHFISPKENKSTELKSFDILKNPNECELFWELQSSHNNSTHLQIANISIPNSDLKPQVGKVKIATGLYKACTLSRNQKQCLFSDESNRLISKELDDFQLLRPILKNLKVELEGVSYTENEIFEFVNFRGTDRVLNKANVHMEVEVGQSRSKSDETGSSTLVTNGTRVGTKIESDTTGSFNSNSASQSLGALRGIFLPELTSIEGCSTIALPDLQMSYKATGVFSAKPLTASQVEFILKESGHKGPFVERDNFTIECRVGGEIVADVGLIDAKFFINPINILKQNSCDRIGKSVEVTNEAKLKELVKKYTKEGEALTEDVLSEIVGRVYGGTHMMNVDKSFGDMQLS